MSGFHTTRWSVVLAARSPSTAGGSESLARLCEVYWQPVYAYVRRRGVDADEAQDLTQQFFVTFLEKSYVSAADPERGRFRSFLLASVQHFLSNEWDRRRTKKRGGGAPLLPLEFETAEGVLRREPATDLTPERLFARRWAQQLVQRVLERLRAEQEAVGKGAMFATLGPFLAGDREGNSYARVSASLNATPGAVRVAVHRLRRRLRALLIEEIADTVDTSAAIDAELRFLLDALRAPSENIGSAHV